MKSEKEILADVYIAAMTQYLLTANTEDRKGIRTMAEARKSAEKTVKHFRTLMREFPECDVPERVVVPSNIETNPEAGKF